MKYGYKIVCLFLAAFVLIGSMCYGSYLYSEKVTREERDRQIDHKYYQSEQASSGVEQKISSDTKYILELYHPDTEETVWEEHSMPSEYAGMTRKELESYLRNYMLNISDEEVEEGLVDIRLISFSRDELILRKIYQEETGYVLRLVDGEVTVFDKGTEENYEKTGITEDSLTEEEIRELEEGYSVESEEELYSVLENYSS